MKRTKTNISWLRRGCLVLAVVAAWHPVAALAQDAEADADDNRITDIIVTADKRAVALSRVGGGISAVSGERLEELSANSLKDYLATVPGLSLQSNGTPGFAVITIRGIAPQSVGAASSIYIDEIPVSISSAVTAAGNYAQDFDPSDLQRVEVLKGPQGTIYGASSLGGVLKYVTRDPSLTTTQINASQDLTIVDGGGTGIKLTGAVSTPLIEDKLAVRLSGFYRHTPGFVDDIGLGGPNADKGDAWGLRGSLLFRPTDRLRIKLSAMVQDSDVGAYTTVDYDLATGKPFFGDLQLQRFAPEGYDSNNQLYSAEVGLDSSAGTLISATGYSRIRSETRTDGTLYADYYNTFFGTNISPTAPLGTVQNDKAEKFTQELRFSSNRLGAFEFSVGGFYQHEDVNQHVRDLFLVADGTIDSSQDAPRDLTRAGTLSEYAGFANATVYLGENFDLTAGYRHSKIDQTRVRQSSGLFLNPADPTAISVLSQKFSETSNTYLFGARWRPTDDILVYARAASGYRPGGGRSVPPGAPANFREFYESDSLWSYEAGAKIKAFDGKMILDMDGFWIDWSNIQSLELVGLYFVDGNAGTARSRGAEAQLEFLPTQGLTIGGNAAYTDSRFTEDQPGLGISSGDRLFYVPKWTAAAYARYSVPIGGDWKADFGADYQYMSNRLDANRITLPAFEQVNMNAGVNKDGLSINFYIKNLTNERGFIGSNGSIGYSPAYYFSLIQPRTFGIALREKF